MTKLDFLFRQYENLLGWYRQAEEKAKFLVTLNALALGAVNGLVFVGADKIAAVRPVYTGAVWILLALAGVALVGSCLFVLRAMWPRHRVRSAAGGTGERMWFFGDIAAMTPDEHARLIAGWTEDNVEQDVSATMAAQVHVLSRNVWIKHQALNVATALTVAALILFFALGVAYGTAVADATLRASPASAGQGIRATGQRSSMEESHAQENHHFFRRNLEYTGPQPRGGRGQQYQRLEAA